MKMILAGLFLICASGTSAIVSAHEGHDMSWKIVPNKNVCMVTEKDFGKPQIPVEVGGKTYYGCCANCQKTLTDEKSARTSVDPVTNKPVDKATATIAANSAGDVMYFESKANFEKFVKNPTKHEAKVSAPGSQKNHSGH